MVLYSIIKPYNLFFVMNCYIARQILKFTSQSFSTSVAMTSHKHKRDSWKNKVAKKFYKCNRMQICNLYTLN